jgi:steroid delta-isomerase-like uncharacterized protein
MSEANKTIARRWIEELWNKGNHSVADELIASGYTHHDPSTPELGRGPESEKKRVTLYRTAFPDFRISIDDLIAEDDRIAIRWTCRGTHKGDLSGIAPTGKGFTITGTSVGRISGGKVVEGWVNWDALGMFQQLGIVPQLGKAKGAAR